jgi:cytochrome b
MTALENDSLGQSTRSPEPIEYRQVWDWPVRLFHWALVAAFIGAFVTNRLGVRFFTYHVWCGYAVIALVTFRILWGFFGTRHARFANFVQGPIGVLRYLSAAGRGRRTHYAGHNPLGALMVLTLLLALGAQASVGLFANDEIFNVGPLYGFVSKTISLQLTSLHRKIFYWIAAAAALHVAAVIIHVVVKREGLIRAMITGGKASHFVAPEEAIKTSRIGVALTLFLAVSVVIAGLVYSAPSVDLDVASF